jgi:hypothetical protein
VVGDPVTEHIEGASVSEFSGNQSHNLGLDLRPVDYLSVKAKPEC